MTLTHEARIDWETCLDMHERWWKREPTDVPLRMETRYADGWSPAELPSHPSPDSVERWRDARWGLNRALTLMAHREYRGPEFPYYAPCLGPGSLGLFLGATPRFQAGTVWYDPCFASVEEARAVFDPDNPWLQWTLDACRMAAAEADGRYLVAMPDLVEGLDCIAALVGTDALLYALADAPDEVHRLQRETTDAWFAAFDAIYRIVSPSIGGNAFMAFDIVGRGRVGKLQCDLSAMLSPAMFGEFVVPYLREQAAWLDCSLYHLDGPDAIKHLDVLCAIDELDAIQWMPGAGVPWGQDPCWDGVYRKILDAGKSVEAYMPAECIPEFIRKFGTRGVYIACEG